MRREGPRRAPPQREPEAARTTLRVTRWREGEAELVVVSSDVPATAATLTAAEREVARLVAKGLSNEEIARLRSRSARTIANQVAGLLRKLGLASRHQLAAVLTLSEPDE